jgi:predicted O-methyltransferase YrrM
MTEMAGYVPEVPLHELYERSERVGGFRYGPIEAQFLYCFVRRQAPRRIVEVGSGSTTLLMVEAVRRNVAEDRGGTRVTAIDPYAHHSLSNLSDVEVLRIDALDISSSELQLEANDLLFIDSTHTVRTGSEVPHLYLELVPTLPPGVWIHVHDIYLPFLYSSQVYDSSFDWQETTLVAALLTNNDAIGVMACMSALHHARPEVLRSVFPEYRPKPMSEGIATSKEGHFPSSLWLRTTEVPDAKQRDQAPSR